MKEDQPTPGSARRLIAVKNPPQPAGPAIAELQAQVLALRCVVELAFQNDSDLRTLLTQKSGPTIAKIATAEGWNADVVKRAKTIATTLRPPLRPPTPPSDQ